MHLLSCIPSGHGPLLPNVKGLIWSSCHDDRFLQVLPFASSSLRTLWIVSETNTREGPSICQMFQGLAGRPDLRLKRLVIVLEIDEDPGLPSGIASLLLAQSRQLEDIHTGYIGAGPQSPVALALLVLNQLRTLDTALGCANPVELETFLSKLSAGCPMLEDLNLCLSVTTPPDPLPFRVISPLLQVKNLMKLRLRSENGLLILEEDIAKMGKAWARMQDLYIPCPTPIATLSLYAQHFSQELRTLIVNLNFPKCPVFDASTPTFPSLHTLTVTGDPPQAWLAQIAAFLCWVCGPKTNIDYRDFHDRTRARWRSIKDIVQVGRRLQEATVSRMGSNLSPP